MPSKHGYAVTSVFPPSGRSPKKPLQVLMVADLANQGVGRPEIGKKLGLGITGVRDAIVYWYSWAAPLLAEGGSVEKALELHNSRLENQGTIENNDDPRHKLNKDNERCKEKLFLKDLKQYERKPIDVQEHPSEKTRLQVHPSMIRSGVGSPGLMCFDFGGVDC
jgi:hypothetical protein